mmetsp:Transcript_10230/g.32009  ORF Transcript_10230/g.32009 Transcript_10230/m.32009 type:complete len:312 (-) Transcript_10230:1250-2185(-)
MCGGSAADTPMFAPASEKDAERQWRWRRAFGPPTASGHLPYRSSSPSVLPYLPSPTIGHRRISARCRRSTRGRPPDSISSSSHAKLPDVVRVSYVEASSKPPPPRGSPTRRSVMYYSDAPARVEGVSRQLRFDGLLPSLLRLYASECISRSGNLIANHGGQSRMDNTPSVNAVEHGDDVARRHGERDEHHEQREGDALPSDAKATRTLRPDQRLLHELHGLQQALVQVAHARAVGGTRHAQIIPLVQIGGHVQVTRMQQRAHGLVAEAGDVRGHAKDRQRHGGEDDVVADVRVVRPFVGMRCRHVQLDRDH